MARMIDPPRLTDNRVDVPESIRELLSSARRDTPTTSQVALLKQRLGPLLDAPPAPAGFVGPISGPLAGFGKIVIVATLVATSGLTYWMLRNHTDELYRPAYSVERPDDKSQSSKRQNDRASVPPGALAQPIREPEEPVPSQSFEQTQTKRQTAKVVQPDFHSNRVKQRANRTANSESNTETIAAAEYQQSEQLPVIASNSRDDLGEAALLGLARNALAIDPARTLQLTFEHYRKYGTGVLGEEREVLIIEALMRLGQKQEARQRARNFVSIYPQSVYRRRLDRQILLKE
ncbi:MAG: hypothetical protein JXA30_13095 [Deltaproteobacteria bacterium]|nr:hypothetical protein [Deltaproteobacteria bacterium]